MGFKKNAGAKITAIIASIGALIATLVLVQQNPPPSVTASAAPSAAQPAQSAPVQQSAPAQAQQPVQQAPIANVDTRTRGS
ncbi:MAG TPA: hypothetical protein VEZ14_11005 [Dehalococcoidia bacterium]|nr:hypothetical protein [Dehalococcoidia bacterium]